MQYVVLRCGRPGAGDGYGGVQRPGHDHGPEWRTLKWVTPVQYLRGHDSRLFTLPVASQAATSLTPPPAWSPDGVVGCHALPLLRSYVKIHSFYDL